MSTAMWAEAMASIARVLLCPKCPTPTEITVNNFGDATCTKCGHKGPIQLFQRGN